ncbi:hypothetical protein C8R45DRAFT_921717 [Mycena sanguinolenta]|nr:hypothetical protein C8R45DRAFT_921717 [Mycena sanguinolenta]
MDGFTARFRKLQRPFQRHESASYPRVGILASRAPLASSLFYPTTPFLQCRAGQLRLAVPVRGVCNVSRKFGHDFGFTYPGLACILRNGVWQHTTLPDSGSGAKASSLESTATRTVRYRLPSEDGIMFCDIVPLWHLDGGVVGAGSEPEGRRAEPVRNHYRLSPCLCIPPVPSSASTCTRAPFEFDAAGHTWDAVGICKPGLLALGRGDDGALCGDARSGGLSGDHCPDAVGGFLCAPLRTPDFTTAFGTNCGGRRRIPTSRSAPTNNPVHGQLLPSCAFSRRKRRDNGDSALASFPFLPVLFSSPSGFDLDDHFPARLHAELASPSALVHRTRSSGGASRRLLFRDSLNPHFDEFSPPPLHLRPHPAWDVLPLDPSSRLRFHCDRMPLSLLLSPIFRLLSLRLHTSPFSVDHLVGCALLVFSPPSTIRSPYRRQTQQAAYRHLISMTAKKNREYAGATPGSRAGARARARIGSFGASYCVGTYPGGRGLRRRGSARARYHTSGQHRGQGMLGIPERGSDLDAEEMGRSRKVGRRAKTEHCLIPLAEASGSSPARHAPLHRDMHRPVVQARSQHVAYEQNKVY